MSAFKTMCEALEAKIQSTYEEGVTLEQAEKLAAEFLHAQMRVSRELSTKDLDARMRKTGVKAIRAAIYLEKRSGEGKMTEATLSALVDSDSIVQLEQSSMDEAEVNRDELERLYNVFQNAHVYFRGVAKGNFGG